MNPESIYHRSVESLGRANWITDSDQGAVTLLLAVSRLIDQAAGSDEPNLVGIASLVTKHLALMDALKLTPKSRESSTLQVTDEVDHSEQLQQDYLRITNSAPRKQTVKRANSRASSGGTGDTTRDATNALATVRSKPRATTKRPK
jgi:hypothetical protein